MPIRMEREDDTIVLDTPMVSADRARQVPGARHDARRQIWRYPLSWATCVVARAVFGDDLEVGPALSEWAYNEKRDRVLPALAVRELEDEIGGDERLFPFQRAGVAFLEVAGSALLADEMGTGKTVQAISTLAEDRSFPALIVCPNSVKANWAREFKKWAPDVRVLVTPNGLKPATDAATTIANGAADVLIVNWEALKSLSRLAPYGSVRLQTCMNCDPTSTRKPNLCQREDKILNSVHWAAVVADEAHKAKNPEALQTRALWALGDKADRRIALTGTPVANHAADLWSIMRFVAPTEWAAKTVWVDRYAVMVPNIWSGFSEIEGLRPDMREELDRYFLPRFLRRTKAQVLRDLPPKVYERRDVVLSAKQQKAYSTMEKEMVAAIEGGTLVAENGLTASLRLRQLASAYGEVESIQDWSGLSMDDPEKLFATIDQQVKLSEPSSKLDELELVLEELGDRQAVIFAESSQLIELAYARLLKRTEKVGMIIGDVPVPKRSTTLEEFRQGELLYLLCTVGAGGEGLDGMQVADVAIFLQRPWSAVLNKQAEDRLHRIGQEAESVTYIDLVATGTVEEKVFAALEKKGARMQDVVRDGS